MKNNSPFDEHTEPAFEQPTERVADELLARLASLTQVHAEWPRAEPPHAEIPAEGETRIDAPFPTRPRTSGDVFRSIESTPTMPPRLELDADATRPVPPVVLEETSDALEVTSPGLMPVPRTGAEAVEQKRGDVEQLL